MKTFVKGGLVLAGLLLVLGTPAKADNIHINCTPTCISIGGSQGIGSANPTFSITNMGTSGLSTGTKKHPVSASGTLYLVVLLPGNSTLTFKANGTASGSPTAFSSPSKFLFPTLKMSGGNPANLNAFASITQAVLPSFTTKTGYSVFDISLGAYNFTKNGGPVNVSFSMFTGGKGFPLGTIFFSFLRDNNQSGLIVDQTPFSEALVTTKGPTSPTPEPATLGLMGTGLLALAGLVRRRLR